MTEKQDKVKLEDIIGLVKTDEPTNSVELKKQIYNGYDKSHITRFKLEYDKNAYKCVYDSVTDELICNTETIVSMMNDLYRENCLLEQLKDESYEEMGAFNYDALLKIADLLNEKSYQIEQLKKENEAQSDAIDSLQELLAHIDLEEMNIL